MQNARVAHINLARTFRGGERQTALLAAALSGQRVDQMLVVRKGSELARRLRAYDNLRVVHISKPFVKHLPLFRQVDVLHAHEGRAAQLAFLAHSLLGTRYVLARRIPNVPKNNPFTHGVYRRARSVIALSQAVRQVIQVYEPRAAVRVIPSMTARFKVEPADVRRIRDAYPGRFIVGHVGALVSHHKGQEYIIEAARALKDNVPEMLFLLVGEGADETRLKQLAMDLDNVRFVGFKQDVAPYIAAFDVFLFPSLHEGLGSSLLDAMDLGRPIVATEVGGIPEIVRHDDNGMIIPPRNARAIAQALRALHENPALRRRLARNARIAACAFYPDNLVGQYLDVYDDARC